MSLSVTRETEAGFTLVEVLVAMFIFSIISVGSVSALSSALNGKTQIDERLSFIGDIGSARALMAADFGAVIFRPVRDNFGANEPYVFRGGIDSLLTFTRSGRPNPGGIERRGDLQRVSYHFENNSLIRRTMPHENPAQNTKAQDRVLLSDIANIDIVFFQRNQGFGQKVIEVPVSGVGAPSGLKMSITFEDSRDLTQTFELDL